jgi:hypothetical protein
MDIEYRFLIKLSSDIDLNGYLTIEFPVNLIYFSGKSNECPPASMNSLPL